MRLVQVLATFVTAGCVAMLLAVFVAGCVSTKLLPTPPAGDRCQELRDNIDSTRASIHELRWTQEAEARSSKEYIARLESEISAYTAALIECERKDKK